MPTDVRVLALGSVAVPARRASNLELGPVDPRRSDELAALYLASYPPEIGAADLAAARGEIDETFAGTYGALRPDASFIASRSGRAVGAVLTVERSVWDPDLAGPFVIDLFVAPESRGSGVGRLLMESAIERCRLCGDETVSLRVGAGTSAAAHALYEHLGFTQPLAPVGGDE